MKIFINEKVREEPWGGGVYFLKGLVDFLTDKGFKVIDKLEKDVDLIFILSNSFVQYKQKTKPLFKFKKKHPNVKVLHRINTSDIAKNTNDVNDLILKSNSIADETVFISQWLADYFIDYGFNRPYHVIYNGCDSNLYHPLNNKQISDKVTLVTHHWSNNWMKGFDIYNELDKVLDKRDDFNFTYIGRYIESYKPNNINLIPPLYGEPLAEELRKCDIYITAARWEGCGMHHIEGACCGLPVLFHRDGGGINEACRKYGIEYDDLESLLSSIEKMKNSYQEYRNKIDYKFLSIERCVKQYYEIIQKLL